MSIFLCYSRKDEKAVVALVLGLEAARRDVWFDHDLGGGDAWWDKIIENICRCNVFVFAVSDDALHSKPCRDELDYARLTGRPVLPVQVGPVESFRGTPFAGVQVVGFRPDDATAGFEIIAAIDQAATRAQQLPDPLPPPPPIPYGYLHAIGRQIDSVELDPADQLKVVDQLRRALGEETDPTVRRDIFAMLDNLMRKPWSTRRTEKEIRAVIFAWDTSSLITMSPGLEEEMARARSQEQTVASEPHETVEPPAAEGSADLPTPTEEADPLGEPDPVPETPSPPAPRRRRAVLVGTAGSALVVGLLVGLAVAPRTEQGASSATNSTPGTSVTAPGPSATTATLPASAPLPDDEMVVPVKRDGVWQLDLASTHSPSAVLGLVRRKEDSRFPVLSPDRRTMIYVAVAENDVASLRVAAVNGAGDRPLFEKVPDFCSQIIRRPAWNPTNSSLLAIPCVDSSNRWTLGLVRTDGTETGKVAVGRMRTGDPTWNADGTKLAFWGTPPSSKADGGALYVANGNGTRVRKLTRSGPGVDADPAWNPAGPTLAFRRHRSSGVDDICQISVTSSVPANRVVDDGASNTDPAWSLSGRSLAYISDAPVEQAVGPTPGPTSPPTLAPVRRVWVRSDNQPGTVMWGDDTAVEQNAPAWTRR